MGDVAKEFHGSLYGEAAFDSVPEGHEEIWMAMAIKLEVAPDVVKNEKRKLTTLVVERNRLIHAELATTDFNSVESCEKLSVILDEQNPRILDRLTALRELRDAFKANLAELKEHLESDQFLEHLVSITEEE